MALLKLHRPQSDVSRTRNNQIDSSKRIGCEFEAFCKGNDFLKEPNKKQNFRHKYRQRICRHTKKDDRTHVQSPPEISYVDIQNYKKSLYILACVTDCSARKPPWPRSMPSRANDRVLLWRGCGLRHAARRDARHCRGTVRSPSAKSA